MTSTAISDTPALSRISAAPRKIDNQLDGEEGADDNQRCHPAGKVGEAQSRRQQGGDPWPDVWNKAQHRCQKTPEQRIRNVEEKKYDADGKAETAVDQQLCEQIMADFLPCFFHRLGCNRQTTVARNPYESVA
jgi:hypothetical protein